MRLFLILVLVTQSVLAKCPAGSTYSKEYDKCYLVSQLWTEWPVAEAICNIRGGHLASIHSQAQRDYILALVNGTRFPRIWIGSYLNSDSKWKNTDGSPFNYSSFKNPSDETSQRYNKFHFVETDNDPKTSWAAGRDRCSVRGEHLANDLSDSDNNMLTEDVNPYTHDYWIGLFNNGSGYMWDRGVGKAPVPLSQSKQYWLDGGYAPPYDPNYECVSAYIQRSTNQTIWKLARCKEIKDVKCQKTPESSLEVLSASHPFIAMWTMYKEQGLWQFDQFESIQYSTAGFICDLPRCGADNASPASILNTSFFLEERIVYSRASDTWYFNDGNTGLGSTVKDTDCSYVGAHLPSVGTPTQNVDLMKVAKALDLDVITLGYAKNERGVWSWTDGSNATYTNWVPNQPLAAYSYSAFTARNGYWSGVSEKPTYKYGPVRICAFSPPVRRSYC